MCVILHWRFLVRLFLPGYQLNATILLTLLLTSTLILTPTLYSLPSHQRKVGDSQMFPEVPTFCLFAWPKSVASFTLVFGASWTRSPSATRKTASIVRRARTAKNVRRHCRSWPLCLSQCHLYYRSSPADVENSRDNLFHDLARAFKYSHILTRFIAMTRENEASDVTRQQY